MLEQIYQLSRHFLSIYQRPFVRYFFKTHHLDNRFTILLGQRGVGKSTALVQYLLSSSNNEIYSKDILYVPSDHFLIRGFSLYKIAEEFVKFGGKLICFDEVHKFEGWSNELKSIFDTFPELKILASGSSILEVHKGSNDLSRRAVIYTMYGMSFREFIALQTDIEFSALSLDQILSEHTIHSTNITETLNKTGNKILPLFKQYLEFGYFPYFVEFKDIAKFHLTLEQQIHTTLESDLLSVYPNLTGDSIRKLKKLLVALSQNVPYLVNYEKLRKIVDVADSRTIKIYLKYLEDAGIIFQLRKSGKIMGALEKVEKIFLNNTNQLYAIGSSTSIGTVRETFFANIISSMGEITLPKKGDFLFASKYLFEIGGKGKTKKQIAFHENSYLVLDNIEHGIGSKIPLWLFGFIY